MYARLAQLVRSLTANHKVPSSVPDLIEGVTLVGRPSFATPSVDKDVKPLFGPGSLLCSKLVTCLLN